MLRDINDLTIKSNKKMAIGRVKIILEPLGTIIHFANGHDSSMINKVL